MQNRYLYLVSTEDLEFLERIYQLIELQKHTEEKPKVITSFYIPIGVLQRYDKETKKIVNIENPMTHKFLY